MSITFLIPSYLRAFAAGKDRVELTNPAGTVAEALGELWKCFPGLRDRVLDEQGQVRRHVNIFVGEENIRDTGGLTTSVLDGCEIMIVPNVAGG